MTIAEELQKTNLFHEVSLEDLQDLITHMTQEDFNEGDILFHEGDLGDAMYIIRSGRIRVFMYDEQQQEITLTYYEDNQIFGELSPIDQQPRSASVMAVTPLQVLKLDRGHFLDFLDERPEIGLAMMRGLSERLRNTTDYLEQFKPKVSVPVAPVSTGEEFRRGATGRMAEILDRVGSDADEEIEITGPIKVPYTAPSPADSLEPSLEPSDERYFAPAQDDRPRGVFDRIVRSLEDVEEEPPDEDSQPPLTESQDEG